MLEHVLLVPKHPSKGAPRESLLVDHVDEHVDGRFYVVSSRLVEASARVERGEQEVACELVQPLLLVVSPRRV